MKINIGMEAEYEQYVKNNSEDPYSLGVVQYAQRWAEMMEAKLAEGESIASMAEATSHAADTDGITGFMYGAAVGSLAHFWLHGQDLRLWHNAKHGVSEDQAKGGTVNPAIVTIGDDR